MVKKPLNLSKLPECVLNIVQQAPYQSMRNLRNNILLIGILVLGHTAICQTNEWHIFRGDPALTGASKTKIQYPLTLKWTFKADDDIVAAPVVGDNTIFVSSIGGIIYALDVNGKEKWKFTTDNSIEAPALYQNSRLYVGNLSGNLYALDAKTGKLIWTYQAENQIMGSANYFYLKNKLFIIVGSYDYYLHCIDGTTGKMVWKYESDNYINGAPAISTGAAVFGGCDGYLHVVNLADGKLRVKINVATYIAGSVALEQNLAFTGDYDGLFSCIDMTSHKILWHYDNPSSNLPILGSPAILGEKVIIGGQDKYLRCFNKSDGKEKWNFNAGGRIDASPAISGSLVITATMDGIIYMVDSETGRSVWSYEIGSAIAHNPAIFNGGMVVSARDGNIYYFRK